MQEVGYCDVGDFYWVLYCEEQVGVGVFVDIYFQDVLVVECDGIGCDGVFGVIGDCVCQS